MELENSVWVDFAVEFRHRVNELSQEENDPELGILCRPALQAYKWLNEVIQNGLRKKSETDNSTDNRRQSVPVFTFDLERLKKSPRISPRLRKEAHDDSGEPSKSGKIVDETATLGDLLWCLSWFEHVFVDVLKIPTAVFELDLFGGRRKFQLESSRTTWCGVCTNCKEVHTVSSPEAEDPRSSHECVIQGSAEEAEGDVLDRLFLRNERFLDQPKKRSSKQSCHYTFAYNSLKTDVPDTTSYEQILGNICKGSPTKQRNTAQLMLDVLGMEFRNPKLMKELEIYNQTTEKWDELTDEKTWDIFHFLFITHICECAPISLSQGKTLKEMGSPGYNLISLFYALVKLTEDKTEENTKEMLDMRISGRVMGSEKFLQKLLEKFIEDGKRQMSTGKRKAHKFQRKEQVQLKRFLEDNYLLMRTNDGVQQGRKLTEKAERIMLEEELKPLPGLLPDNPLAYVEKNLEYLYKVKLSQVKELPGNESRDIDEVFVAPDWRMLDRDKRIISAEEWNEMDGAGYVPLNEKRKIILLRGDPAVGKTLLMKKLATDWARKSRAQRREDDFYLIFFIQLANVKKQKNENCLRMALAYCASEIMDKRLGDMDNEVLQKLIEQLAGKNILFLLDGLDEGALELKNFEKIDKVRDEDDDEKIREENEEDAQADEKMREESDKDEQADEKIRVTESGLRKRLTDRLQGSENFSFVITSRSYSQEVEGTGQFVKMQLLGLTSYDQRVSFMQKRIMASKKTAKDEKTREKQNQGMETFFLEEILPNKSKTDPLFTNPILLTFIYVVVEKRFTAERWRNTEEKKKQLIADLTVSKTSLYYQALQIFKLRHFQKLDGNADIQTKRWFDESYLVELKRLAFHKVIAAVNSKKDIEIEYEEARYLKMSAVEIGYLMEEKTLHWSGYCFQHRTVAEFFAALFIVEEAEECLQFEKVKAIPSFLIERELSSLREVVRFAMELLSFPEVKDRNGGKSFIQDQIKPFTSSQEVLFHSPEVLDSPNPMLPILLKDPSMKAYWNQWTKIAQLSNKLLKGEGRHSMSQEGGRIWCSVDWTSHGDIVACDMLPYDTVMSFESVEIHYEKVKQFLEDKIQEQSQLQDQNGSKSTASEECNALVLILALPDSNEVTLDTLFGYFMDLVTLKDEIHTLWVLFSNALSYPISKSTICQLPSQIKELNTNMPIDIFDLCNPNPSPYHTPSPGSLEEKKVLERLGDLESLSFAEPNWKMMSVSKEDFMLWLTRVLKNDCRLMLTNSRFS